MVKFESIFWRQALAVLLAVITYSLICGDVAAAIGPLFLFFLILSLQEWVIDKIEERGYQNDRSKRKRIRRYSECA